MSIMRDWPISRRLAVGLAGMGATLALVAGVGVLSSRAMTGAFEQYRDAATGLEAAETVLLRTSEFAGAARGYAARGGEAEYAEAEQAYARAEAAAAEAAQASRAPEFQAAAAEAEAALSALRASFDDLVETSSQLRGIVSSDVRWPALQAFGELQSLREEAETEATITAYGDAMIAILLSLDFVDRAVESLGASELDQARASAVQARELVDGRAAAAGVAAAVDTLLGGLDALEAQIAEEVRAERTFFETGLQGTSEAGAVMIEAAHHLEDAATERQERVNAAAGAATLIILLVGAAMAALVGWLLSRSIVPPLSALTEAMGRLAQGDLTVETPDAERKDELGRMAKAFAVLKDNSVERVRLEEDRVRRAQAARHNQDAVDQLVAMFGKSIEGVLGSFDTSSSEMGETAERMRASAETTHSKVGVVSEAMTRAEAAIQTIASAAQEMTGSVAEIGQQAGRTAEMSRSVRDSADGARADVERLAEAVSAISGIVELIDGVAEQTNLLALNATIEAARAGEAGKGFAVVASEVKALAGQTGKATEEITRAIAGVGELSTAARTAMERIQGAIAELDEVAETVASAAEEQQAATEEIARSASSLSEEAGGIVGEIEEVTQAGAGARKNSLRVKDVSGALADEARVLADEVRNFLEGIGDAAVREVIVPRDVAMAGRLRSDTGEAVEVRVVRLSPAFVELADRIEGPRGAAYALELPGHKPVRARLADSSGQGARLQLPMDRGSLDEMERFMLTLPGAGRTDGGEVGEARAA